jgi:hypothetical protein
MVAHFDLAAKSPTIVQSGNFGFDELVGKARFDMIWIFQVFIHLTDEHVRNAMRSMSALLADKGAAYGTAFINDGLETLTRRGNWRHYALAHGPVSYYRDRAAEVGLALEAVGVLDKDGWAKPKQPPHLTVLKMTRA